MPHPWHFSAALIWLAPIFFHGAALAEPVPSPKVVFVIVDGIPADVIERVPTPAIDAIAEAGGYSRAAMGGPIGELAETPTISAPGYMSLITGTWANKHNVYKNYGISPDYSYWNLFRLARSERPELRLGIFSTWTDNRTILLGEGLAEGGNWRFDVVVDGLEKREARLPPESMDVRIADIDDVVSREAARLIESEGPDLSWVYLQHTDDVAHKHGDSVEFEQAVIQMDERLHAIWSGVRARQRVHEEDWLVIVTTDHGRDAVTGRTHGAQSKRERTIWMATNSQRLTPDFYAMPQIVDIYPSIAMHLGITIPEQVARHLDGASFIE
ncbi:MAG: nucleotide pyrophosphatase [Alteromonadaceae bacterium]|nr:nucleotide pyrophosphatase [Alteromonadaceae bacterium]